MMDNAIARLFSVIYVFHWVMWVEYNMNLLVRSTFSLLRIHNVASARENTFV